MKIAQNRNAIERVWSELPMPQIIFEKKNGTIVGFNPKAKSLFGYAPDRSFLLQNNNTDGAMPKARLSRQRFTDMGLAIHKTNDGRELSYRVYRKIITWKSSGDYSLCDDEFL